MTVDMTKRPAPGASLADLGPTLRCLAARTSITLESERLGLERLADDSHDTLNMVLSLLERVGVALPDPNAPETAATAWL